LKRRPRLSRPAQTDLTEIWLYIAEEEPRAADRLIDRIWSQCQRLAALPRLGRLRPDLAPEIRVFPVGRYLILYRETESGIEVARIRAGEMDLTRLFPD